jgi:hypothetical protein
MTAIAVAEPFTDDFLDGLIPLLHHRAARNLWRPATAGLCAGPERALLEAAVAADVMTGGSPEAVLDTDTQHLQAVVQALEKNVAWHSPACFQVAANIARVLSPARRPTPTNGCCRRRVRAEASCTWTPSTPRGTVKRTGSEERPAVAGQDVGDGA